MKNKKLIIILCLAISAIFVVFGAIYALAPKTHSQTANTSPNYTYGKGESLNSDTNKDDITKGDETNQKPQEKIEKLTYYINDKNVTKTIQMTGETKIFKISFALLVKSEYLTTQKIMCSGFSISYDIDSYGTFLSSVCTNYATFVNIDPEEMVELKFELTYVITNNDFDSESKYNLIVNYLGKTALDIKI